MTQQSTCQLQELERKTKPKAEKLSNDFRNYCQDWRVDLWLEATKHFVLLILPNSLRAVCLNFEWKHPVKFRQHRSRESNNLFVGSAYILWFALSAASRWSLQIAPWEISIMSFPLTWIDFNQFEISVDPKTICLPFWKERWVVPG